TFLSRLRELGLEARQRNALTSITTGAAARLLRQGQPLVKFIEQGECNRRRLAKLNLPPSAVLRAVEEYDRLWIAALERPALRRRKFPMGEGTTPFLRHADAQQRLLSGPRSGNAVLL